MNNIVIDIARIAAIILMRGLVLSVIWVIAYLIWRLIFAKKGKKRPWLLDSLSRLVIITVVFALIGIIGTAIVFGIYWLICWLLRKKSKQNPVAKSGTTSSHSFSSPHQPTSSNAPIPPLSEYSNTIGGTGMSSTSSPVTSTQQTPEQKVFTGPAGGYWKNSAASPSPNAAPSVTPDNPSFSSSPTSSVPATDPLIQSANAGDKNAQYRLGMMYANGAGSHQQDKSLAATWLAKAAEQGHAEAMYRLALLFLKGDAVVQDKNKARYWLTKAAEQGVLQAKTILKYSI